MIFEMPSISANLNSTIKKLINASLFLLFGILVAQNVIITSLSAEQAKPDKTNKPAKKSAKQPEKAQKPAEKNLAAANKEYKNVVLIKFDMIITPASEQFFYRKLQEAEEEQADLLIVQIDSPGGVIEPSFNLAERLSHVDWAKTVAFVPKSAYSGGTVMALGCDEIVLGKDGQIGDVGAIFEKDGVYRYVPEKEISPWVEKIRILAERKDRSPALAQSMMKLKSKVFVYTNKKNGEKRFMSVEDAEAIAGDDWEKGPLVIESSDEQFLTVTGKRGIELGLTSHVADSVDELKEIYQIKGPIVIKQWETIDTVVGILNIPFVTGLILFIGLICLYVEFSVPGIGVGGLMALLCFAIFFWSKFLGGTSEWLEVLLFFAGVIFLLVELFVIPGFGIAGLTGVLLMLASIILASHDFALPRTAEQQSQFLQTLLIIAASGAVFVLSALFLSRHLNRLPMFSKITLVPPEPALATGSIAADESLNSTSALLNIGQEGICQTALRPSGKAMFNNQRYDVVADGDFIDPNTPIRVMAIKGNRIVVQRCESDEDE